MNEFSPEFEQTQYSVSLDLSDLEKEEEDDDEEGEVGYENDEKNGEQKARRERIRSRSRRRKRRRKPRLLAKVEAKDGDCSMEFGSICRYELLDSVGGSALSVDHLGRIWMHRVPLDWQIPEQQQAIESDAGAGLVGTRTLRVIAHDCAGKRSQSPAQVHVRIVNSSSLATSPASLSLKSKCKPALKGKCAAAAGWREIGARAQFVTADSVG